MRRRLVFTFGVEKYTPAVDQVTVEIVPQATGCEVTLIHRMQEQFAAMADRTREGWAGILEGLATFLSQ